MIKIENTGVFGWEAAIRGMRNPMNSWEKSDSDMHDQQDCDGGCCGDVRLGENDLKLMKSLAKGGPVHAKYRRMIVVYADITAPLYWWKEFDTYKVGTVANSCSTMHKIHAKEFTLDDFSHEHLINTDESKKSVFIEDNPFVFMEAMVICLNNCREKYLETKDKKWWWQMIQLLPSSYNQRRTVMMNYEMLANVYRSRKDHKLDEWKDFCKWAETLPYFKEICID